MLAAATRIAHALVGRTKHVNTPNDAEGLVFRMDPAFFIEDLTSHNATSLLSSVARHAHVRLVHTGGGGGSHGAHAAGSSPWGAARASELATSLMDGGAFDATGTSLGDKAIQWDAEQEALAKALTELAHLAGSDQARTKRAAALAKPPPRSARPGGGDATPALPAPPLSAELEELKASGADVRQLGALGRQDRASLKAKLKELGYKSLRVRVKLEEELMGLPPPARG